MIAPLNVIRWREQDAGQRASLLQRPVFDQPGLSAAVAEIVSRVRNGRDGALSELTAELMAVHPGPSRWRLKTCPGQAAR